MNTSAEGPGAKPGQPDPRAGPSAADPLLEKRATQARKLTAAAGRLTEETRRLRRGLPNDVDHPHDFWLSGLDTMKGHLEEIAELHEDCELLVKQMSKTKQAVNAGESKANGEDAEQMELRALSEELTQLDEAIARAASVTRKAIAAVRGRSTDDKREDAYFAAAGELADIVGHFEALISQLRGEAGLPGPPGTASRPLSTI
jgi:hypothetical protein